MKLAAALLLCLALCACGAGNGAGSGGAGGSAGTCSTDARASYPTGPYGVGQGAIIDDLSFVTPAGSNLSLGGLHGDSNTNLIYLITGAGWCGACLDELPTLQSWHETYAGRGLAIVIALFEDQNYQPATTQLATQWINQYSVTFSVVADPPNALKPYYPNQDSTTAPLNLFIDACTMEIISSHIGVDANASQAIIEARL